MIISCSAVIPLGMWVKSRSKEITPYSMENQITSCPLCEHSEYSIHMQDNAWNNRHGVELRKCNSCDFVFSAVSVFDYDAFSANETFPTQTKEQLKELARTENLPTMIDEIIQKTNLESGKSLDFGCGIGLNSLCLQDHGYATYGVELSQVYLNKHKELGITSAASLADLSDHKESFDLVIMKDVLEHVNNPAQLLSEVVAFVKPGGYFYIRVPNVYHYPFHWSIDTKSHINHFSPQQLMTLLEKNNMQKVDFIGVYDISTSVGKLYNFVFWKLKYLVPMYHQISLLYQKKA
jgi:2-polyprenyl-3-methyl-5-hydroxy-6-metoxy-1,4-benzoquinol methylase